MKGGGSQSPRTVTGEIALGLVGGGFLESVGAVKCQSCSEIKSGQTCAGEES